MKPKISKCQKRRALRKASRQRLRVFLLTRQGNLCYYCPKEISILNMTLDHRIPKSKGGKNHKSNIVAACHDCNHEKDNQTDTEYILTKAGKKAIQKLK